MKKLYVLLAFVVVMPFSWSDGIVYEVGYSTIGSDTDDPSVDLGALYGLAGYRWDTSTIYSHNAEVSIFLGSLDEDFDDLTISLKPSYEVAYRGTFTNDHPGLSFFWRAMYGSFEIEAESQSFSISAEESGFGLSVGAEFYGINLGYAQYFGDLEDLNRIYIGYRLNY